MRYCKRCIIPETRPFIRFNSDGICNACENHLSKTYIDWASRQQEFRDIVLSAKSRSRGYDCLIPVSGGKDSTWQVLKCLEYDLKPLTVSYRPPLRTPLGVRNLDNLVHLGVDHLDYRINPLIEKKFLYEALVRHGNVGVPMHMAIFNTALTVACRFDIPLIVWGEDSGFEYGGERTQESNFRLDSRWLKNYSVTQGTTADHWVSERLERKDLIAYLGPTEEELDRKRVLPIFLAYYFRWDPVNSLELARAHGFRVREEGPKTGYYNYADLDDDLISVHHFLKWYKFGFTRSFDNLSIEIRNGRMTREKAVDVLWEIGDDTPHEDIAKFCDFVGVTKEHFFEIAERFRNRNIWLKRNGTWMIEGFLIPDWKWS